MLLQKESLLQKVCTINSCIASHQVFTVIHFSSSYKSRTLPLIGPQVSLEPHLCSHLYLYQVISSILSCKLYEIAQGTRLNISKRGLECKHQAAIQSSRNLEKLFKRTNLGYFEDVFKLSGDTLDVFLSSWRKGLDTMAIKINLIALNKQDTFIKCSKPEDAKRWEKKEDKAGKIGGGANWNPDYMWPEKKWFLKALFKTVIPVEFLTWGN